MAVRVSTNIIPLARAMASRAQEDLKAFLNAPEALKQKFIASVEAADRWVPPWKVAAQLDELGIEGASGILRFLFHLSCQASDEGQDPLDLIEEFLRPKKDVPWDVVGAQLARLLESDLLLSSVKIHGLMFQNPRTYVDSRFISELRPIFMDEPENGPSAFLVLHNLKLEFVEAGEKKDFYVTLDSRDLRGLREYIDRAIKKEHSMKCHCDSPETPLVVWYGQEDGQDEGNNE